MDDLFEGCVGLVILGIIVVACLVAFDMCSERQSFDAQMACETRRMVPERKMLSSKVVCTPSMTRQDTTTVTIQRP